MPVVVASEPFPDVDVADVHVEMHGQDITSRVERRVFLRADLRVQTSTVEGRYPRLGEQRFTPDFAASETRRVARVAADLETLLGRS